MRRDWNVIRTILLRVEAMSASDNPIRSDALEGIESTVAGYHMWLLVDAKLVIGSCVDTGNGQFCHVRLLTWKGSDFLNNIRKDTMWERIKETAEKKGLELTFDSVVIIAKSIGAQLFSSL